MKTNFICTIVLLAFSLAACSGGGKMNKLKTELILGGSAKSLNLAMMGPQLQNETKKQTSILERIAKNTQKTEENTRSDGGENYEVVNG